MPAGNTTYSSEDNSCAVPSTRRAIKFLVGEGELQRYRYMLQSEQEEPDTRLLLHAMHGARTGSKAVIVTSEDPDVMLLCLAFQKDIPCPIYQKCGTENNTRFVEISKLAWSLGDSVCDSLIGLHAFTGCDTVSAFASRRKLSALKPMKSDITYLDTFIQVGQSWDVQPQLSEKVLQFTCRM